MSTGEFLLLAMGVPAVLAGGMAVAFLVIRWLLRKR